MRWLAKAALQKGLGFVTSKDAIYLPGWCGPAADD